MANLGTDRVNVKVMAITLKTWMSWVADAPAYTVLYCTCTNSTHPSAGRQVWSSSLGSGISSPTLDLRSRYSYFDFPVLTILARMPSLVNPAVIILCHTHRQVRRSRLLTTAAD